MRRFAILPCFVAALAACAPPVAPQYTPPPMPPAGSPSPGVGASPAAVPAAAAFTAADEAAIGDVALAVVRAAAIFTAQDADSAAVPFKALQADGFPTVAERRAGLKILPGTYAVDVKAGGARQVRTSAEPANASVMAFQGAGDEPLHGLRMEYRGFTPDWTAKDVRSLASEGQGLVMSGGKNLFAQGDAAQAPSLQAAREVGFGADAASGTVVSCRFGANTTTEPRHGAYPVKLELTSRSVVQLTGDFTFTFLEDRAAGQHTFGLKGAYAAKAPGGDAVLKTGTVDETRVVPESADLIGFFVVMELMADATP